MKRAFTLIEVLLTIGLLVALLGAILGFGTRLAEERTRTVERARLAGAALRAMERIESAMLTAVAGASGGGGVVGDTTSLRLISRAVWVPVDGGVSAVDPEAGDKQGLEVRFDAGRRVLQAREWDGGGAPGSAWEDASGELGRMRFRYLDGREWKEAFDSGAAGRLPSAIEVSIWYVDPQPAGATDEAQGAPLPEPDQQRVVVVPDGPSGGWAASEDAR